MATVVVESHAPLPSVLSSAMPGSNVYMHSWRPWMSLYNIRLRQQGSADTEVEMAPIQKLLPTEIMHRIFMLMPVPAVAVAQAVCKQWKQLGTNQQIWKVACMEAFPKLQTDQNSNLLKSIYKGSWQALYLEQPHVRYDGVYVSRNTYLRTGIVEWRTKNPVHLVCYFRYLRFFADGQFLYRTSPEVVSKVAKLMMNKPVGRLKPDDTLQTGIYRVMSSKVYTALVYANSFQTEVRTKLRLRSTCRGANNRLDVESMVSYDKNDGVSTPMMGQTPEDEEPEDPRQLLGQPNTRAHARGMEPYVFVPWDKVHNHVLNMDVKQMDFYVPG